VPSSLKNLFLAIVVLLLLGCVSQGDRPLSDYTLIDWRSYDNPLPDLDSPDEFGSIVVSRDGGVSGSALRARLYLDGVSVVNLRPGQYVELKVRPGEHELRLKSNGFALLPVETMISAEVSRGSQKRFRVLPVFSGGMQIQAHEN